MRAGDAPIPAAASERDTSAPHADGSAGSVELPTLPESSHVTAEDLAAALLGDGTDTEAAEEEEDEFEWEDAGVPVNYDSSAAPGATEASGSAQPQRRDMWSRTHGYKFGRKLGDWSGPAPAAEVSPAQDPLEAAALSAAAEAAEGAAVGGSLQEQRQLQHGILNSLGVHEPDAEAAALHAAGRHAVPPSHNAAVAGAATATKGPLDAVARRAPPAMASRCAGGDRRDGGPRAVVASDHSDDAGMEWEDAAPADPPQSMQRMRWEEAGCGAAAGTADPPAAEGGEGGGVVQAGGHPIRGPGADSAAVRVTASVVAREPTRTGLKMSMPKWGSGPAAGGGGRSGPHRPPRQASGTAAAEAAAVRCQDMYPSILPDLHHKTVSHS